MFKVELPYDIGTFVKVKEEGFKDYNYFGTVASYTVVDEDDYLIWVSGYKEACAGEYLPKEVTPMTDEEIEKLIKERG